MRTWIRLYVHQGSVLRNAIRQLTSEMVGIVFLCAIFGCSTHAKRISQPRNLFYEGQILACREGLEKLAKSHKHDRDVVNLDLAIVDLLSGQPKQAESRLKEVRDRFDVLEQDSLAEKTLSMWTDDQVRSYAGEDYEKILIRVFLALSNLMYDGTDAESFALQIQDKHEQLAEKYFSGCSEEQRANAPPKYCALPIGYYMRGLLREATHRDYDDAVRNYQHALELLPQCSSLQWDLSRAQTGAHSQAGNGVVYVFAMVGRGPYKIEVTEKPTSDALLIADRIVSAVGPYKLPPTIAPIKIPDIAIPVSDVDAVFVQVDGQRVGPTTSITNVEQLSLETYRANRNSVIARAVARRVIKKATIVAAKDSIAKDGLASLGMDIAGIAWEATEAADTRCWGLLPRDIQILRVEMPAGEHALQFVPLRGGQPVGPSKSSTVHVVNGRNAYAICWFPDSRSQSSVMSSQPQ